MILITNLRLDYSLTLVCEWGEPLMGAKSALRAGHFKQRVQRVSCLSASRIDLSHKGFGEELFMIMPIFSFNVDSPNNLQI